MLGILHTKLKHLGSIKVELIGRSVLVTNTAEQRQMSLNKPRGQMFHHKAEGTHIKEFLLPHREPEVWLLLNLKRFLYRRLVFTQNSQLSSACSQTNSDLIQTIQSDSGRIFTPSVTTEVWETKGVVRWGRGKC